MKQFIAMLKNPEADRQKPQIRKIKKE